MKRILILFGVILSLNAYSQKSAVQTAFNYLRYDDLDKAKEAIDGAATTESTIGYAKTWYYRGSIYHAIYESTKPEFAALKPGSLNEAKISYEKTLELDAKNEFKDDVMKRLEVVASQCLNSGVDNYKEGKYAEALKNPSRHLLTSTKSSLTARIPWLFTMPDLLPTN